MGLLTSVWSRMKAFATDPEAEPEMDMLPDAVPGAKVFQEMQSVEESLYQVPKSAPVVMATGSAIQVNKPLKLKTGRHAQVL